MGKINAQLQFLFCGRRGNFGFRKYNAIFSKDRNLEIGVILKK
jgi:hypothetical protein